MVLAGTGQVDIFDADHFLHVHFVLDHGDLGEFGVVESAEDLIHVHFGNAVRRFLKTVVSQV